MNIIVESIIETHVNIHIDQEITPEMLNRLREVRGVSWVGSLYCKYCITVHIGKEFDKETVLLNCQAELIKLGR